MASRFLAGVLLIASALSLGWCETVSLDGEWRLCRTESGAVPGEDAEWSAVKVPSFVRQMDGKPFLWYRRLFVVPAEFAGRRVFLRFGGVKFVTQVYLNGQKAGGHFGGWEPFEVEITRLVRRDADNRLLVRVQDVTGVIAERMDYAKQGRGIRLIEQAKDAIMAPIGSQYTRVGIWQPVSLIARNDVFVEDVFVQTSVRQQQMSAEVTLRNLSGNPQTVILKALLFPGPRWPTMGTLLDKRQATLDGQSSSTIRLKPLREGLPLWEPHNPVLHRLWVEVSSPRAPDQIIDRHITRFGFREFWVEGEHLVLNGTRMKFLATAGHPRGTLDDGLSKKSAIDFYRRIREAGCVAMRLHANVWPEAWYEAADEVGMPLIMESALFCYSQNYALTKPEFWKNYHDHLAAIIRHKRNHPSIVMYSLENEILHCGGEHFAKDCEHRLAEAGRFVKSLDPTRPIMYDADGDPEGVADVVNLHYPLDFDRQNLWPQVGYWLEKGMKVRGWPHKFYAWDRKKPLYFGEFLHIQHHVGADPFSVLLGDDAYIGHGLAMARCKARAWEMQIEAYRACDVSGLCPWTLTETGDFPSDDNPRYMAVKRAYRPIAAFIREYDTRFYEGETVKRTVNLYNDTLHPARLTFEWELKDEDKVVASGRRTFDTKPAQRIPFSITLKMPEENLRHPLALTLRVRQGKRVAFEKSKEYSVFPRVKLGGLTAPLCGLPPRTRYAVFEGQNKAVSDAFRKVGRAVQTVRDLANLPDVDVVVIGPHALDGLKPPQGIPTVGGDTGPRETLAAFVRNGGRVVVLEQDSYDCGLLPARLVDRGCTIAFPRTDVVRVGGPLGIPGVHEEDFRFWRGDHLVARKTIAKPQHGRFLVHIDSGGPDGLVHLPLLEVMDGKGSYLLSQLLIGEKLDKEPMAQALLELLLRYVGGGPPLGLAVVQGKLRMTEALDEIDAIYNDISGKLAKAELPAYGVLLAEADANEVARNVAKLRQFVNGGGKLILHAGTRAGIARLARLFPEKIVAQPNTSVPVNIAERDPVINGLTNQDLYWYGSREGLTWRVRTPLSTEVCDHVIGTGMPDPEACRTFEAEQMALDHGKPDFRDAEVYLYANGGIKAAIDFPGDGEYAFIVRGRGTPVAGVYPQIAIAVDGRRCGSVTTADEAWGEYFLTSPVEVGRHEVSLAFVNDAWAPERGEDRNVSLDWLRVGPVPPMRAERFLNPPALVKLSLGKGVILLDQVRWDKRPGDERASRYLSNILTNLNCDFRSPVGGVTLSADAFKPKGKLRLASWRRGVVYFGTNGTITTRVRFAKTRRYEFAIRAWGTEAAGEFPNIALGIDGKKVGDVMLRRPGWHTVRLAADVAAGEHEVALSFTNDFYDPPADRNLRIGHLQVR